jgi:hypothetical protein
VASQPSRLVQHDVVEVDQGTRCTALPVVVAREKAQVAYETLHQLAVLGEQPRGLGQSVLSGWASETSSWGAERRERALQLVRGVSDEPPLLTHADIGI